jgi:hypothetical protein
MTEGQKGQKLSPFIDLTITDRDHAIWAMKDFDLEAQLLAIRGLLHRNREQEQRVSDEIKELEVRIKGSMDNEEYLMMLEGDWADRLHNAVFQDAAHSLAALGLLAPFVESLFASIFRVIHCKRGLADAPIAQGGRKTTPPVKFWDPYFVYENGKWCKDLVPGIVQLSVSCGLTQFLPTKYESVLSALFKYRNKMFHNGFEWPLNERVKFKEDIKNQGWPTDWFTVSETNGQIWIFYLSSSFIEICLQTIDHTLEGVGRFIQKIES